jgi:hypothetical protein
MYSDYPGADYSVCRLSVHDSFFNLQYLCHIIRHYKYKNNIWFIKADTSVCDSYGVCASTQGVSGKCVRRTRFSVCV